MHDTAVAPQDGPTSTRSRTSSPKARTVPGSVWAITAFHVGLLLTATLLYPAFTGFDEAQHVDAVLAIRHGDGWPAPQERELSVGVVNVATPTLQELRSLPFSDDEPAPRAERPSVASLGVDQQSTDQALPNQMTQHPPLYYAVGAAVLAVVPGSQDWPFDRTVGVLRLLSVLLMAPLPVLAWATAQALGASRTTGVTGALLAVSVPQLQRVGGSVNNDAGYTLAFAVAVVLLARIAMGDLRRRTVVTTGVVVGLALLTKGFALALPLAVALSFAVGGRRSSTRRWWLSGLACLVVAFAVGGWWWLRNIVLYGTVQPAGWPVADARRVLRLEPRLPGDEASVTPFLDTAYMLLSQRFWGGLAINYAGPDTFPFWLTNVLAGCALLAVVAAVALAAGRRLPLVVSVGVPFAGTVGIVLYGIWSWYVDTPHFPGAQGRYLFGALPSLAAAVALGLTLLLRRAARVLPLLAALLAFGMQAWGLVYVLRRSWLPPYEQGRSRVDRYGEAVEGIAAWAPWPEPVTAAVFGLTAVAGAVLLYLVVRLTVTGGPAAEPAGTPTAA